MEESTLKKIRRIGKFLNALHTVSPSLAGSLAFKFFCTPRRPPIREEDGVFLSTARQSFLKFKNLKISYYTWQSANPVAKSVLLLHGWESNSARWRKYVKGLLAAGFTVYAIDAPASGNSQGNRLNVLLLGGAIKEFIVKNGMPDVMIGHSLGGAAAVMSATVLEAGLPSRMILMGVFAESTRVIEDFGRITGTNEHVIRSLHREVEKRSGIPIKAYSVAQKSSLLRGIPALVIHDFHDEIAPVAEGRLIAELLGARFLQTEGLGHRLQDKAVVKAVVDFSLNI